MTATTPPASIGRYLLWGGILAALPALVMMLFITLGSITQQSFDISLVVMTLVLVFGFFLAGLVAGIIGWLAVLAVARTTASPWYRALVCGLAMLVVGGVVMAMGAGRPENFGTGSVIITIAAGIGGFGASAVHESGARRRARRVAATPRTAMPRPAATVPAAAEPAAAPVTPEVRTEPAVPAVPTATAAEAPAAPQTRTEPDGPSN